MKISIGTSYVKKLTEGRRLDTTVYVEGWRTTINMSVWEDHNASALAFEQRSYLNYDRFLPMKWARKLATYCLNRQSRRVAGIDLIPKEERP